MLSSVCLSGASDSELLLLDEVVKAGCIPGSQAQRLPNFS
jgi:hypothetical protein